MSSSKSFKPKNKPVRHEDDPPEYTPGGTHKVLVSAKVIRSSQRGGVDLDPDVWNLFGDGLANACYARMQRDQVLVLTRELTHAHVNRLVWMGVFKQLCSSMHSSRADVVGLYGGTSRLSFTLPTAVTQAVETIGTFESDGGIFEVMGAAVHTSSALLRAIGGEVERFMMVEQEVTRRSLHLDLNLANPLTHLLEYCLHKIGNWCSLNPVRFALPNGDLTVLTGMRPTQGCAGFFSAFSQGTAFPEEVVRMIRIGAICEDYLRAQVGGAFEWAPPMVQRFSEQGVVVTRWERSEVNARVAHYLDVVQTPLCAAFELITPMKEVTVLGAKGSPGQLVHRTGDDKGECFVKLGEVDAEMGMLFGSVGGPPRANPLAFRVTLDEGSSVAQNKFIKGFIKM